MSIVLMNLKDDQTKAMNADTSLTFDRTTDSLEAVRNNIGSAVGASISADIAAVKAVIGTPAATYVSTDIAAIKTVVDAIPNSVSEASATTTGVIVEDATTGTPSVVTIASSATENTFGSWTQIDASASANSWICSVIVMVSSLALDTGTSVVEIGTGANPNEAAKIRFSFGNTYTHWTGAAEEVAYTFVYPVVIPIKVASGTRISARVADSVASAINYKVSVQYYQTLEA